MTFLFAHWTEIKLIAILLGYLMGRREKDMVGVSQAPTVEACCSTSFCGLLGGVLKHAAAH